MSVSVLVFWGFQYPADMIKWAIAFKACDVFIFAYHSSVSHSLINLHHEAFPAILLQVSHYNNNHHVLLCFMFFV